MENQPGPVVTWASHALVGYVAAKTLKGINSALAFVLGVLAHMWLDAPVARLLLAGS